MALRGDYGSHLPSTQIWDSSEIQTSKTLTPELKELFIKLYQNMNRQTMSVNDKDAGLYDTGEFVNGQTFFPDVNLDSTTSTKPTRRQVFRKVLNFGALPNAAEKKMPHGIELTDKLTFTRIYGTATDLTNHISIPLPYVSATDFECIELRIMGANVSVVTSDDRTPYTVTYVVLEYLKN